MNSTENKVTHKSKIFKRKKIGRVQRLWYGKNNMIPNYDCHPSQPMARFS